MGGAVDQIALVSDPAELHTVYFEFQRGRFDLDGLVRGLRAGQDAGKSADISARYLCRPGSVYLVMEVFDYFLPLVMHAVPSFDYTGPTLLDSSRVRSLADALESAALAAAQAQSVDCLTPAGIAIDSDNVDDFDAEFATNASRIAQVARELVEWLRSNSAGGEEITILGV
jgi:hypothetical protein